MVVAAEQIGDLILGALGATASEPHGITRQHPTQKLAQAALCGYFGLVALFGLELRGVGGGGDCDRKK